MATLLRDELGVEAAQEQLGQPSDAVTRKHYIQRLHEALDSTLALEMFAENSE